MDPIPDSINHHNRDLTKVFQALNGENVPAVFADVFDIGKITTTIITGFHTAVGPAPDTSVPSFN